MKIQFVNPHNDSNMYAAPKFFRYASSISNSLNFKARGALFPPLNLATLAALTPPEHEVAIDDGCLSGIAATRPVPSPRHSGGARRDSPFHVSGGGWPACGCGGLG